MDLPRFDDGIVSVSLAAPCVMTYAPVHAGGELGLRDGELRLGGESLVCGRGELGFGERLGELVGGTHLPQVDVTPSAIVGVVFGQQLPRLIRTSGV